MNTHTTVTEALSASPVGAAQAAVRPASRAARWGAWALMLGFGGFVAWAAWAPLDEGVPTHGVVAIDTKRKAVQHLSGGIVQQVLVREGDLVREDQTLIVLDEKAARANYEAVRQRYLGLRAMQGRLMAEQLGATTITWHPDLLAARQDPWIEAQMQAQQQLLRSRREGLQAELRALEEASQGQQAVLRAYQAMLPSREQQLASLEEELRSITALVHDGYAPRTRQNELQRQVAELKAQLADLQGNIERAQRAIAELRQRSVARQQEFRKDVENELTRVNLDVQADAERYRAAQAELQRTEIRAPATGQVVGLAVQSVGAVIQPGQKLMDIVPLDETLLLETRLEPHLIDKVRAGLKADVRFSTFAHSPQLVVEGEVVSVSGDLLADPHTGAPYYLMRVKLTEAGMHTLGPRKLQPGMPVEVIVKTGERSLLTYLAGPLVRRVAASLKEE
ncbi:protease secretion system membrane fusion protein [Tepidimonas ignava]|uniref:Membrane fusion protein (MFP) family protein n=1 Tax=Tepidimonas ignava TaxID=114249 RepID=A0A4R3LGF2_9BURK|nr:HlyD family type I secretion periplasmic adaptor subunit [Tepidimonas ignava]TCS97514.1 protease secretion system membrane fusion protein [Tepidimonas ignava]TSE22093.1 Type I secretion system membrane fusion protein PrsE [Tepidimonas ignava]